MLTVRRATRNQADTSQVIGPAPWIVTSPPGPMAQWAMTRDRRPFRSFSFGPYPLVMRRAKCSIVEDVDGNRYLDFSSSNVLNPAGHNDSSILEAIAQQAQRLVNATEAGQDHDPSAVLAARLAQLAPGQGRRRVLLTTGADESVRAAARLACDQTGSGRLLLFEGARHGPALAALARARRRRGPPDGTPPGDLSVQYVPYGDLIAVRHHLSDTSKRGRHPAAVFVEPVQAAQGYMTLSPDALADLRALCDEHGALLVVDETPVGLGRPGTVFWCQQLTVVPDILIAGCGTAGGALSFLVASDSILSWTWSDRTDTPVGQSVSCAAALAMMDLLDEHLIGHAARLAGIALAKLEAVSRRRACLGSPSGTGMALAVHVARVPRGRGPAGELRDRIISEAFRRGLLLSPLAERGIQFTPPLCINRVQIEVGLDVFEEAVATVTP